ncbi:hypothetical protein [Halopseudomonas pelagia]|uniref:hypothetical protein n=1 Tax=Halopseudomonas pelagia TaxID=553151 RepID=UPI0003A076DB|nr:hypothetical protein [Halopseudomonas pelagia]
MSAPDEDDEGFNPLDGGAATPPRMIGGGCLARYDPEELNDDSGVDFPALADESADPEAG